MLAWKIPCAEKPGGFIHRVTKSQTRQSERAHTSTAHPLVHNRCKSHSHRLVGRNEHLPCWPDYPDPGWWCGELFPCQLSGRGLTSAGFQRKEALPESWAFPPALCSGKFCLFLQPWVVICTMSALPTLSCSPCEVSLCDQTAPWDSLILQDLWGSPKYPC